MAGDAVLTAAIPGTLINAYIAYIGVPGFAAAFPKIHTDLAA